jgi:hypothetical protein
VSDPSVNYNGVYSEAVPARGVISIIPGQRDFRLRSRTADGDVVELVGLRSGDAGVRLVGPRILKLGLLTNGDFEEPFGSPWLVSSRAGVDVQATRHALDGGYSLMLRFRRAASSEPSSLSQVARDLPARAGGTRYIAREVVLTRNLSRHVSFGLQLLYVDSTSRYFVGGRSSATGRADHSGIPAGSGPTQLVASGVAEKPVSSVRVFAVDAGAAPVRGVVLVDDVELTAERRPGQPILGAGAP